MASFLIALENILGNGEYADHLHVLLFPNLFPQPTLYLFPKQALVFTCLLYKSFENTVGKGEIARNEQFRLFPQCFLPVFCHLHQVQNCRLQSLSVWKSLKFVVWERVKESHRVKVMFLCLERVLNEMRTIYQSAVSTVIGRH